MRSRVYRPVSQRVSPRFRDYVALRHHCRQSNQSAALKGHVQNFTRNCEGFGADNAPMRLSPWVMCGLTLSGCFGPAPVIGAVDASVVTVDASVVTADASVATVDAGPSGSDPSWQWVPIDGSVCASGARAGVAINSGAATQLVIYLEGGGACWNQGTCVPSLLQFGPICSYGNFCLYEGAGGQRPTAAFVELSDPFPADGGGVLPSVLAPISKSVVFDRARANSPFRDATFVYVPYCTGDLHSGNATRDYPFQSTLGAEVKNYRMHFAGATNIDAYLAHLKTQYPGVTTIWLIGLSAGGYGATLHLSRVQRAFPSATVRLLADSAPYLPTNHWAQWRDAWNLQMPQGCGASCDGGYPAIIDHVISSAPSTPIALLSTDRDSTITYFFYSPDGLEGVLNPPLETFNANLKALLNRYDASTNAKYFVIAGNGHVIAASASVTTSPDGGTLESWIDAWARGDANWSSTK